MLMVLYNIGILLQEDFFMKLLMNLINYLHVIIVQMEQSF